MVKQKQKAMKKIILAGFILLITFQSATAHPDSTVNDQLQRSFRETFPDASRVTWDNIPNGYVVCFMDKDVLTRITYDKKGEFSGSIRSYSEKYLPIYLVNIIKTNYRGHKIFGVTEVASTTDINYYVKLEGPRRWITVLLESTGFDTIVEKYL